MTTTFRRHAGQADDREVSARLLPPPVVPDLGDDRQLLLKEHFVSQIIQSPAPAPAPRRPRARPALRVVPIGAAIAVAAVVAVSVSNNHQAAPPAVQATATAMSPSITVPAATSAGVVILVDHIISAAKAAPALTVGPKQFVYIESDVAFTQATAPKTFDGPAVLDAVHERQVWLSQSPGTTTGLIRENGRNITLHGGSSDQTYATLAAIPTDPSKLRAYLAAATAGKGPSPDAETFAYVGDLLREAIVPPQLTAALYRFAATIPGVQIVSDSVDAAGRHGIALARTDAGERTEWIFDKATYSFLGERSYLVQNTAMGKAGMLTGSTAVLARGVVDKPGELPAAAA